jgi:COMPASS component SPP1
MPAGNASVGPESEAVRAEKQEEEEDSDAEANEDDKLYCVCKTKYDEDRFMIACDRWVFVLYQICVLVADSMGYKAATSGIIHSA